MLVGMVEWLQSVVTPAGVVIFCVVVAIIVFALIAPVGKSGERRYCPKCGETTWWHPTKGCEHCAWCERQW